MGSRDEMERAVRNSQLEHERDELRSNVEQLSGTTNIFGGIDFVSLLQGRRPSGVENVVQECTQKLEICQRENIRLQEELSEVYTIKSKFAELLKTETEKSSSLEKEVKFYQNQVAAALSDRDRSLLEIQTFQRREVVAMKERNELQKRLDLITSEYGKEQDRYKELQKIQETFKEELGIYRELVERFWRVRGQVVEFSDGKTAQEKAVILLQDPEGLWSFGEMIKHLNDQIIQARDNLTECEENSQQNNSQAFRDSEDIDAVSHCRKQLSCFAELLTTKVQQLHSANKNLKDDINFFIKEEKSRILSLLELCRHHSICYRGDSDTVEDLNGACEANKATGEHEMTEEEQNFESGKKGGELAISLQEPTDNIGLENIALTQDNMASDFFMHQQEDIHVLVSEVAEISSLKQQLLQVTTEKVNALLQVEQWQKECVMLQDQERGYAGPSSGDKNVRSHIPEGTKKPLLQGYLKHLWPLGWGSNMATKSLINVSSMNRSKESDPGEAAKLRINNAVLQENLWCIHNLCKSVKQLRQTIAKAGIEPTTQTEVYVRDALTALDGVIAEALNLEIALKLSLPSNDVEWHNIESSIVEEVVSRHGSDGETTNDDVDTVVFYGLEMVRLVLFAANLQRRFIQKPQSIHCALG